MSMLLDLISESNVWNKRFAIPTCPPTDNPWLYGAYALKVMRSAGLDLLEEIPILNMFEHYGEACRVEKGLFNRHADNQGGYTSHDELMGMAYISPSLAREIYAYLEKTDGVYINKPELKKEHPDWAIRYNVYRMIFLRPFLKARADYSLNPITQLTFAAHLVWDAITTKPLSETPSIDAGGRLRNWIMLEAMEKASAITGAACDFWRKKMNEKGYSPKNMLAIEPGTSYPIIARYAKDTF